MYKYTISWNWSRLITKIFMRGRWLEYLYVQSNASRNAFWRLIRVKSLTPLWKGRLVCQIRYFLFNHSLSKVWILFLLFWSTSHINLNFNLVFYVIFIFPFCSILQLVWQISVLLSRAHHWSRKPLLPL